MQIPNDIDRNEFHSAILPSIETYLKLLGVDIRLFELELSKNRVRALVPSQTIEIILSYHDTDILDVIQEKLMEMYYRQSGKSYVAVLMFNPECYDNYKVAKLGFEVVHKVDLYNLQGAALLLSTSKCLTSPSQLPVSQHYYPIEGIPVMYNYRQMQAVSHTSLNRKEYVSLLKSYAKTLKSTS